MKPEKPKPKKRLKKRGAATIPTRDSVSDKSQAGHEERLILYRKRAFDLKRVGYTLAQIADMIYDEFNLERVPNIMTVSKWVNNRVETISAELAELQMQLRLDQFNDLELAKRKWLAIATADHIQIQRWKFIEGELQPFMDENATDEQLKATNEFVKICARQAKLMGLDMEKAAPTSGDGPASLQDLQVWLINQCGIGPGIKGAVVDVQGEVLELKSGVPEIDNQQREEESTDAV